MLEKLALKHDLWVKMARGICKDVYLADDLVSEMYLKFSEYDNEKEVNEYYVYYAIKHLFVNWLREEKKLQATEIYDNLTIFEEDEEKIMFDVPDCISWVEKQILLLRQEMSGHEISRKYHIHSSKVYRIERVAKEKIKIWLKSQSKDSEMLLQA